MHGTAALHFPAPLGVGRAQPGFLGQTLLLLPSRRAGSRQASPGLPGWAKAAAWSLLLWRYSRPAWTRSSAACC